MAGINVQQDLFISGQGGYHTYRIPALVTTLNGTVLAFCEARKDHGGDSGHIDLVLRRSEDGGRTWSPMQIIASDPPDTVGNPAPVVDRRTGVIWLLFCKNLATGNETAICAGQAPRTVWVTSSADDGHSWAEPKEITSEVKRPNWTWYATGPCHGIQLAGGRLLIPCDHVVGVNHQQKSDPHHSHLIYSDDAGASWHIGAIAPLGTNESTVVETADGAVYLNCRNHGDNRSRVYCWSKDGGETFIDTGSDGRLPEPVCQASLARFTQAGPDDRNRVLFCNPVDVVERKRLTVRVSYDECRTWAAKRVLYHGPTAYSDMCITADKRICCMYENGDVRSYERISLACFDISWLALGQDTL